MNQIIIFSIILIIITIIIIIIIIIIIVFVMFAISLLNICHGGRARVFRQLEETGGGGRGNWL